MKRRPSGQESSTIVQKTNNPQDPQDARDASGPTGRNIASISRRNREDSQELSVSDVCTSSAEPGLCFFSSCVIFSSSEFGSRGLL